MMSPRPDDLTARNAPAACCAPDSGSSVPLGPVDGAPEDQRWVVGRVTVRGRPIPRISTGLTWRDRLGSWMVRWSIKRMDYRVPPGLYAVGRPDAGSVVLVSANYKQSFDRLRAALEGTDIWILVIDTRGVNVWCAAGKGTFGTEEIIRKVKATALETVVSRRILIIPQLGAPGVSARRVRDATGFSVRFGPVYAHDIPAYLSTRMNATPEMRRVRFTFGNRLVLIPTELVQASKWALGAALVLGLVAGLDGFAYSIDRLLAVGPTSSLAAVAAIFVGASVPAALLPWIPVRTFAAKGALVGLACAVILFWLAPNLMDNIWSTAGWSLFVTAACSYLAMNFTGCTTFTSLSGVLKEMKWAVPSQIGAGALGLAFIVAGRLTGGAS